MGSLNVVAVAVLLTFSGYASAAGPEYPVKPIRYIVATGPGGASDLIGRSIAPPLSEVLGAQIVVDNRSGAGNTVGAEIAARAAPDGYTLLSCNIASLAVGPALYKSLSYDPERDFAPLGMIANNPNAFSVNPSVQATSIGQLTELVKANPGKLNYASGGVGTSPQLSMELFTMRAGINLVHIPYKGVGPAQLDLMAGRVQVMTSTVPSVLSLARSGKVRTLVVTSQQRDPQLPDVPTLAESGMPDFEVVSWQGLCTNAGAPRPVIRQLRRALAKVLAQSETQKRILNNGFQLYVMPADKAAAYMKAERVRWA
jgi:tripartite-type tricarboxylate transporter receptor subunit TctC